MGLLFQPNRLVGKQATVPAKASSVPGIKQTAMRRLSVSANPRVPVPKSRVTSLSPTFAGRDCTLLRLKSHIGFSISLGRVTAEQFMLLYGLTRFASNRTALKLGKFEGCTALVRPTSSRSSAQLQSPRVR